MMSILWLLTLLQVTAIIVRSDDAEIPQEVSDMLRGAARVTKDSNRVQRAEEMCGYKYCDPQYDCATQSSGLLCKVLCQSLKNIEDCDDDDFPECEAPCICGGSYRIKESDWEESEDCCTSCSSAEITSLNYPNDYPSELEQTWNVTFGEGHVVQVEFIHFDVEAIVCDYFFAYPDCYEDDMSTGNYDGEYEDGLCPCLHDRLEVYDGTISKETLLGRYCNTIVPPETIKTTTNTMLIRFTTDLFTVESGFKLKFSAQPSQ